MCDGDQDTLWRFHVDCSDVKFLVITVPLFAPRETKVVSGCPKNLPSETLLQPENPLLSVALPLWWISSTPDASQKGVTERKYFPFDLDLFNSVYKVLRRAEVRLLSDHDHLEELEV